MKRILAMAISVVLVATMAIGGSIAYLQDTDGRVNTMTLGKVTIDQIEQEWNEDNSELVDFTQAKPLYPYVGKISWGDKDGEHNGAYRRFGMNNVVDKYVSVKNTGKSDAYIRTIIALEMGSYTEDEFDMVGISNNAENGSEFKFPGAWNWDKGFVAEIDGHNYWIMTAVHKDAVIPGATTIPSLLQVYLDKTATNETCEKLDGNTNGLYDILVVSQAVQTLGFEDANGNGTAADEALDEAFGKVDGKAADGTANIQTWFGELEDETVADLFISSAKELRAFAEAVNGGKSFAGMTVALADNIDLGNKEWTPIGLEYITHKEGDKTIVDKDTRFKGTFDGQGYTISNLKVDHSDSELPAGLFGVLNGTVKNLVIDGVDIQAKKSAGAVAGSMFNTGLIDKCTVKDATVVGYHYLGGVVGNLYGSVTNCTVDGVELTAEYELIGDNKYDNADKVGGIVGFSQNDNGGKITGNTAKNVTITGYRNLAGIVGYGGTDTTIENNTVSGLIVFQDMSQDYKGDDVNKGDYVGEINGKDKESGFMPAMLVTDASELVEALKNGGNAVLGCDIKDTPVVTTAPYGNYYGVKLDGGTLDGNGKTLDFEMGLPKAGTYDNYGIMTSGGTIKNATITGVFRGIMVMYPTEDVIIDNVTIGDEDMCYAINTAEGNGEHSLHVSNSTIKGWSSYGTAIKDLKFTNCTFAQGEYYKNVYGRLVKPYVDTVFENCEFNSKHYIDLSSLTTDGDVVLRNCTVNGVKLTQANWKELIAPEDTCDEGQISIEGKNGSYMSADNIFDYVIIE